MAIVDNIWYFCKKVSHKLSYLISHFHPKLHLLIESEISSVSRHTSTSHYLGTPPEANQAFVSVEDAEGVCKLKLSVAGLEVSL